MKLVLVGGGHAHVQVLASLAAQPVRGLDVEVVCDHALAVYSGMVPGVVAGDYAPEQCEIDVEKLAARAGARFTRGAVFDVEASSSRLRFRDLAGAERELAFDLASLDVGSSVRGRDLPGVAEHAIATRPIGAFVRSVASAEVDRAERIAIVGGGAAGVELAFAFEARFRARGVHVCLVLGESRPLAGYRPGVARAIERAARRRGIEIVRSFTVERVDATGVYGPGRVPADLVVWATGAAAHDWVEKSGLPVDARGFVRVDAELRVEGRSDLFAVGDCAALAVAPDLPKAGVYAVRQGPVLTSNLRSALAGERGRAYVPQRDFLTLLNLGDGRALGTKWGAWLAGRSVFRLKDWIDRRFVDAYPGPGRA